MDRRSFYWALTVVEVFMFFLSWALGMEKMPILCIALFVGDMLYRYYVCDDDDVVKPNRRGVLIGIIAFAVIVALVFALAKRHG